MLLRNSGALGARWGACWLSKLGQRGTASASSVAISCAERQPLAHPLSAEALAAVGPSARTYYERRPAYRAVLVDAAGTFLIPSEPVSAVYLRYARPHGCCLDDNEVLQRFRRAYNMPWLEGPLRYVGDARPFWKRIVEHSTGCQHPEVFEGIYQYYSRAEAWHVTSGAVEALQRLKAAGVLLAVVSNFDTRLRPLLHQLGVESLFDSIIVSAEVNAEKPNPVIFDAAVSSLSAAAMARGTVAIGPLGQSGPSFSPYPLPQSQGPNLADYGAVLPGGSLRSSMGTAPDFAPLTPDQVVHVGDDRRNDCWGARDAGITAWLWGDDVRSWQEVADRVLLGIQDDDH